MRANRTIVTQAAGGVALLAAALLLAPARPTAAQDPAQAEPRLPPTPTTGRIQIITTRRARLGVTVNMQYAESDSVGALIQGVTPSGPAARAGIRSGDVITRINGRSLTGGNLRVGRDQSAPGIALTMLAAGLDPGDTVTVQFLRGKELKTTSLIAGDEPTWAWGAPDGMLPLPGDQVLERLPRVPPDRSGQTMRMKVYSDSGPPAVRDFTLTVRPRMFMLGSPLADLELAPLNPRLGRYFGTRRGVLVIDIPRESRLGLEPGDVVFAVDGRDVASPTHLLRVLQSYVGGEEFQLDIMRDGKKRSVTGVLVQR